MTVWKRALNLSGWRGRGLDIIIGGLSVLGHAPFHVWPISIAGFVYLMCRLDAARSRQKGGFGRGFWFGFGYFLFGTFWIGSAFIVRGPEFIPVMPPMILGLAALLSFFWGLAGWVYARLFPSLACRWVALAVLLILAEFGRGHLLGGFPWNLPGYIFKAGGAISQSASYLGIYGLSFLIFLVCAGLAKTLSDARSRSAGLAGIAVLAALFALGTYRLSSVEEQNVPNVKLRIVQVPFSQKDKFEQATSIAIVNDFIRESIRPGLSDVTHVVWPEGAVVGMALENRALLNAMGEALTYQNEKPPFWLLNSLRYEIQPDPKGGAPRDLYFNTSAIIGYDAAGTPKVMGLNDKERLVPFGEFIPGGRWMEEFGSRTLSTSLASITPAPQKVLASFPGLPPVSPQICYEIIFPGVTPRPKTEPRAEWILNQSNDAWFGKSTGPAQHANIAAYRAIEEGIPVVRSASNGVSGVINPYGQYIHKLGPEEKGILDVNLPRALPRSYLGAHHNRHLFLIILMIGFMCFAANRVQTRKPRP